MRQQKQWNEGLVHRQESYSDVHVSRDASGEIPTLNYTLTDAGAFQQIVIHLMKTRILHLRHNEVSSESLVCHCRKTNLKYALPVHIQIRK